MHGTDTRAVSEEDDVGHLSLATGLQQRTRPPRTGRSGMGQLKRPPTTASGCGLFPGTTGLQCRPGAGISGTWARPKRKVLSRRSCEM